MSASNLNWVCFPCRSALRRPKTDGNGPACPECGADCFCLGYKVEVPRRDAVRAWRELQKECLRRSEAALDRVRRENVRRQHDLEQEIARMEHLGENKDRARQIGILKARLAIIHQP